MRATIGIWVCSVAILSGCNKPPEPAASLRPAVVMTIGNGSHGGWQVYSGEVRSRYEADLGFRIAGKLVERRVNLGDMVRQGQVLARLDAQDVTLNAASAGAQVAAAEADLALAGTEYERARSLSALNFVSNSAVDSRRTQLEAAQARLQQARAARDVAQNQIGYATLVADRSGVVAALPVEAGQVVAAGQPVARLADPSVREILIWIPEGRAQAFKPGMAARIRIWGSEEREYEGVLREIAASADAVTRTYAARVSVSAPDERVRLGATAAVGFPVKEVSTAVSIPLAAVVRGEQGPQVWIVTPAGTVQARPVSIERYRDDQAVLRAGLVPGDRVVTVGAHVLKAGLAVRPVEQGMPVALDAKR